MLTTSKAKLRQRRNTFLLLLPGRGQVWENYWFLWIVEQFEQEIQPDETRVQNDGLICVLGQYMMAVEKLWSGKGRIYFEAATHCRKMTLKTACLLL